MENGKGKLKFRFLEAVKLGNIGEFDEYGIVFTLIEFKKYFSDIKTDYVNSFLPASTIEIGRNTPTNTKFVYRVRKGVYRVTYDTLDAYTDNEFS